MPFKYTADRHGDPSVYAYNIQLGYYPDGQLGTTTGQDFRVGVPLVVLTQPAELIVVMDNSVPYAWMRNNERFSHELAYVFMDRWFPQPTERCLALYDSGRGRPSGPASRA